MKVKNGKRSIPKRKNQIISTQYQKSRQSSRECINRSHARAKKDFYREKLPK